MPKKIQPVIMCGGAGTRVWPESRETMPKQFIALVGPRSTFQDTALRVASEAFEPPLVITNHEYRFLVKEQLAEIGVKSTIVTEPARRDSGPAVAVAAALAAKKSPDTVVALFASDHVITKLDEFLAVCARAAAAAEKEFHRHPRRQADRTRDRLRIHLSGRSHRRHEANRVEAFVEKPKREVAESYVAAGYLWNSGSGGSRSP